MLPEVEAMVAVLPQDPNSTPPSMSANFPFDPGREK